MQYVRHPFNKWPDYKYHFDKAKHCRGNIMMRMHSLELILSLCISSMALWRRQYEGNLIRSCFSIPETKCFAVVFSNKIMTQNTFPNPSKSDVL
jgi:hypothetical protein